MNGAPVHTYLLQDFAIYALTLFYRDRALPAKYDYVMPCSSMHQSRDLGVMPHRSTVHLCNFVSLMTSGLITPKPPLEGC